MVQWSNVVYWTATADPRTNSFQACLFATGGVMLSYLDMDPAVLSWSTESIGYEDGTGASGVQISWNEIPASGTNYYIPVSCHTVPMMTYGCASRLTCAELGTAFGGAWNNPAARGDAAVCGESDSGFADGGTNLCFGGLVAGGADTATDGWDHARQICKAMGARLCTTGELQAD